MSNLKKTELNIGEAVVQKDLFNFYGRSFHKYCWLDISKFEQTRFTETLKRCEATHIIDTRSNPVFRRPDFHTPQLLTFLEDNKIAYNSASLLKSNKAQRVIVKSILRDANISRMCCFFVFLHDSNEGTNSDKKRIKNFLNKIDTIQEYFIGY